MIQHLLAGLGGSGQLEVDSRDERFVGWDEQVAVDENVLFVGSWRSTMRMRTLFLALVLLSAAVFVAVNWSAFTAPTRLSLLVTAVEAPVGLVMLGVVVLVVLAFGAYLVVWQSAILLESRRQTKELQVQRTLADQAEASRFTELRVIVHDELERLADRMTQALDALRAEIRDHANSLAATIGELDDRMQRHQRGDAS
jgi:uncharacterized integral membrane protein